jgi:HD-like signal output (HDOD) protein
MNNDDTVTYSDPDVEALGATIESDQLPAVPAVALAIMAACKDQDVDFHELTSLVSADPALATRFLTLANSGIFGGQRRISSLRAALVRLGLRLIHATSLAFALAAEDMHYAPAFDAEYFWRFALTTSHAAHRLAEQLPGIDADNAYAAGLLQDIGVLALQSAVPDKYAVVLEACQADSTVDQATVERKVLGTTHMLVGGYLLKTWGLPPEIYRPVTFHKSSLDNMPEGLPRETKRFYRVLCLGDAIGKLFNGPDRNIHHDSALRIGEEEFGLARSRMQQILEDV